MVPDPEAAMPENWDEDEDGDWEAPMVMNPAVSRGGGREGGREGGGGGEGCGGKNK